MSAKTVEYLGITPIRRFTAKIHFPAAHAGEKRSPRSAKGDDGRMGTGSDDDAITAQCTRQLTFLCA